MDPPRQHIIEEQARVLQTEISRSALLLELVPATLEVEELDVEASLFHLPRTATAIAPLYMQTLVSYFRSTSDQLALQQV